MLAAPRALAVTHVCTANMVAASSAGAPRTTAVRMPAAQGRPSYKQWIGGSGQETGGSREGRT